MYVVKTGRQGTKWPRIGALANRSSFVGGLSGVGPSGRTFCGYPRSTIQAASISSTCLPNSASTCAIIHSMKFCSRLGAFAAKAKDLYVPAALLPPPASQQHRPEESTLIKTVGWISAGFGAVALGLFIGREMRQRYKFNRRTPYDFYAHSGDEQDVDFGLGI